MIKPTRHPAPFPRRAAARATGFTLVELMISVAIVLVLMLGINYVFSTSARTISTGMAVTSVTREIRGARRVFENDFRNAVPAEEMPALIIHNEMVYAWKDRADKLTDADNNPATFDVDGIAGDEIDLRGTGDPTGLNPASWTTAGGPNGPLPGVFNHRRHRVDRISFFVRNAAEPYARQTGDDNTYINPTTSTEAWIQYGLLRLPANNGIDYWKPGGRNLTGTPQDEQANHNNFFATQWTLGRKLMLLVDPTTILPGTTFFLTSGSTNWFGMNFTGEAQVRPKTGPVTSFQRETSAYPSQTPWRAEESRVDLVAVTATGTATGSPMQRMRARAAAVLPSTPAVWMDRDATTTVANTNRDKRRYDDAATATDGVALNYLSWAKPFVNKANFANSMADQTREAALTTPIFLRGVTQFIVEFAGDFYDQGPAGSPEPLGTIDYIPNATTGTGDKIRWYGMPRETNGTLGIGAGDTQPLSVAPPPPAVARFTGTLPSNAGAEKARTATAPYVFAWGPTAGVLPVAGSPGTAGDPTYVRPSLIRITMELIDPNGRLEDGQRIELVFRLKTPTFN